MSKKVFFGEPRVCGMLSHKEKEPIAILCHGFMSSKGSTTNKCLEAEFNSRGIATLRIDFFGHGNSDGAFEDITMTAAVKNIHDAVAYVKSLGHTRIGLVGSSFGGMACFLAASERDDVVVLANKCPVSQYSVLLDRDKDVETWKQEGILTYHTIGETVYRLKYSFYEDVAEIDGFAAIAKISIPTLIVHGDADASVPIDQSRKSVELLKQGTLECLHGADHAFSRSEDFEKMVKLIVAFVSTHLK